ncbi:MAG TPA: type VI secretion system tube protein Hcp, partial [Thermoanaerobaculia bacterium]
MKLEDVLVSGYSRGADGRKRHSQLRPFRRIVGGLSRYSLTGDRMTMSRRILALSAVAVLCCSLSLLASPIYMKIDGIKGDVTTSGHENWIEVLSFSFGASHMASPTGAGATHSGGNTATLRTKSGMWTPQ